MEGEISVNFIKREKESTVLAACDAELLGKTFTGDNLRLEVDEHFYGGELVSIEVFVNLLKEAEIANLVGEKTVGKAVELGLAEESSVLRIDGIPHVQVLKV